MSRVSFLLGLVASIILHVWLISDRGRSEVEQSRPEEQAAEGIQVVAVETLRPAQPRTVRRTEQRPHRKEGSVDAPVLPRQAPVPTLKPLRSMTRLTDRAASQKTQSAPKGSFAGDQNGATQPTLRINWGTPSQAEHIMKVGQMKLAVVDADGTIIGQVSHSQSRLWQIEPPHYPTAITYSLRLRIVDKVEAFQSILRDIHLDPGQHLAVMIPLKSEQSIEAAKLGQASRMGLSTRQIKTFGGRFHVEAGDLVFEIVQVQKRSEI